MKENIACIILAAGRSTRMKSDIPKVLHPICARPMLAFVLDLVRDLRLKKVVAVLGHKQEEVKKILSPGIKVAVQKRPLGTADAVRAALPLLKGFKGTVLVLYGDTPLLKKETIRQLLEYHKASQADATLLAAMVKNPDGYGRVLRDRYASIKGIVEDKDADEVEREIKEVNTGIICFNKERLASALRFVRPDNRKKEYYLTDIIGIFYQKGYLVEGFRIKGADEALGINSRVELARANSIMQGRINEDFMHKGVSIVGPETTFISYDSEIGVDTVIYPFTVIERGVKIGKRCFIGPFAHLREGTRLGNDVVAGNFLEVVRSEIKDKTLAKHFCYIGDSRIGRMVNIGAGTITANFDGKRKNTTLVKDRVFLGSDTVLVAPLKIGRGAVTAAGAVVVKNVADKQIVAGVPARVLLRRKNKR